MRRCGWKRGAPALAAALLSLRASPAACQAPPRNADPQLALFGGFGYSVRVTAGRTEEQFGVLQPQAAFRLGQRFQYVVEAHYARDFRPDGFVAGLVPAGARYLLGSGRAAPYLQLGAGFCWTDLKIEEISRRFNFILQGGVGLLGDRGGAGTWMIDARWLHYSNAGTVLPNLGFNAIVLLGGWRFR